jgi:hypothetical protein
VRFAAFADIDVVAFDEFQELFGHLLYFGIL